MSGKSEREKTQKISKQGELKRKLAENISKPNFTNPNDNKF